MKDDWLAAFMMSSILLNPQLIIYSAALGQTVLIVRIVSCFLCGSFAGILVRVYLGCGKKRRSFLISVALRSQRAGMWIPILSCVS